MAKLLHTNWALTLALTLISIGLIISSPPAQARKSKCPAQRDQQLDADASRLGFLGDHSFRVPQNMSKMNEFCNQLKGSVGGIQNYARDCLQGFTRQILTTLTKRGKQQHSTICLSDQSKGEFMGKMACLRDVGNMNTFHRCMDASVARYEFIAKSVPTDNKLPALCCSYQIFIYDLESTLGRICGQQPETSKLVQKFVTGTTGEFHHLICEDYHSLDDCRSSAKTREALKQMQEITLKVRDGKLEAKGKSLIPPLLEILEASS